LGGWNPPAEGPGLETGGIPNQEGLPILCFHLEIIMPQIFRIQTSFIPSVEDLPDLIPLLQIGEGPGGFLPLISGVALDFNLFEDPFFIHFFTAEAAEMKLKLKFDRNFNALFSTKQH
jgi:hypothetical protein